MYYSIVATLGTIPPLYILILGAIAAVFLGVYTAYVPDVQLYWTHVKVRAGKGSVVGATAIVIIAGTLFAGLVGDLVRNLQWDLYLSYPLILVALALALQNTERMCFFHGRSMGPQAPVLCCQSQSLSLGEALKYFFVSSIFRYPLWYALGLLAYMGDWYQVICWTIVYGLSYTLCAYRTMRKSTEDGKSNTVNSRFDATYDILVRTGQRTVAAILLIEALVAAILSQ